MRSWGQRARRRLDILAIVVLVGWLVFDLTARTVFGSVPWPQSVVDYRILYEASRHVVTTHQYPTAWPYPYPPPSAAIQAATTALPFEVAAPIWLGLTGLAALATYLTLARVIGLHRRPGLLLVLPLAHIVVAYYFQWDMRSINCNLLVLAVVVFGCAALAAGRDRAAGFWFAASVALKVMPVLVLPYLAWTRRWQAFGWAGAFSVVFWGALPLVAFGSGFSDVYAGWIGELTRATDPVTKHAHPILISLDKAAAHATNGATAARAVSLGVCGLWVVVGLAGAAACWGTKPRDGYAILAHVSLLILGPVAVSPYLEPYHLVPLAVPAVLLLAAVADPRQRVRVRLVAVLGFALGMLILKASSPWPLRGLLVNAQALVMCGAAVWVASARTSSAPAEGESVQRGIVLGFLRRLAPRAPKV
jgi:hypothetical protein